MLNVVRSPTENHSAAETGADEGKVNHGGLVISGLCRFSFLSDQFKALFIYDL